MRILDMKIKTICLIISVIILTGCQKQPLPGENTSDEQPAPDVGPALIAAKEYLDCFGKEDLDCLQKRSIPNSPASQIDLLQPLFDAYDNWQVQVSRITAKEYDFAKATVHANVTMIAEPAKKELLPLNSTQTIVMEMVISDNVWKVYSNGM